MSQPHGRPLPGHFPAMEPGATTAPLTLRSSEFGSQQARELSSFFFERLPQYQRGPCRYLEVTDQPDLYIYKVMDQLRWVGVYDVLDLEGAQTAAREPLPGRPISFFEGGLADFEVPYFYDLIVASQIAPHPDQFQETLGLLSDLLAERGTLFLTVQLEDSQEAEGVLVRRNSLQSLFDLLGFEILEEKHSASTASYLKDPDLDYLLAYGVFLRKKI